MTTMEGDDKQRGRLLEPVGLLKSVNTAEDAEDAERHGACEGIPKVPYLGTGLFAVSAILGKGA